MLIVLLSPPGSGKGTQSRRLVGRLKIPHLSTGDMLREAIRQKTKMDHDVADIIRNGQLVPDDLMVDLVDFRLRADDCGQGCLVDGFPRTLPQAQELDRRLAGRGRQVDLALELRVEREELIRRLLARSELEGREDDGRETIDRRMEIYRSQTSPLLDYYRRQEKLFSIDGMGSADEVFARICQVIDEYNATHRSDD